MAVGLADAGEAATAPPPKAQRRPVRWDHWTLLVVFVGVPFAGYALLVLWPFGQAVFYSLTAWTGFSTDLPFVGLDNYAALLENERFMKAFGNTVLILAVLPVVTLLISYVLAILVTTGGSAYSRVRGLRGSSIYRVVSFFPYVVPAVVIGIIWAQVYDPSSGLLNGMLTGLGLDQFESFAWLGKQSTAIWATIFVVAWGFAGFYMVLFVAAIRGIPTEMIEAARLDGVGWFRMAVSIIGPSILGTVRASYLYMGIISLDLFVFVQIFNADGGPGHSTLVITQQIYRTAFTDGKAGMACAMGVVLAAITFVFIGLARLALRGGQK